MRETHGPLLQGTCTVSQWQNQLAHCQGLERLCNTLECDLEWEGCFTLSALAVQVLVRNVSQCPGWVDLTCRDTVQVGAFAQC